MGCTMLVIFPFLCSLIYSFEIIPNRKLISKPTIDESKNSLYKLLNRKFGTTLISFFISLTSIAPINFDNLQKNIVNLYIWFQLIIYCNNIIQIVYASDEAIPIENKVIKVSLFISNLLIIKCFIFKAPVSLLEQSIINLEKSSSRYIEL